MTLDKNLLESSVRRKTGLLDKLGDAGRFLADLVRGNEVSVPAVKKKLAELEQYLAVCLDQIGEVSQQWERTDRQLAELNRKRKEASRAARGALLAQAELLLRKGEGYQGTIDKLKANGLSAQILAEKLRDLLILVSGPMDEDAIDQWTVQLETAIESREMSAKALEELESVGQRAAPAFDAEPAVSAIEQQLERVVAREPSSARDAAVERQLEELFEG